MSRLPVPDALWQLLSDAAVLGMALGAVAALLLGLGLLFRPAGVARLQDWLERRISVRRAMRPLEVPRPAEPFFYRHHRLVGPLLVIAALVFLWQYLHAPDAGRIASGIVMPLRIPELELVVRAVMLFLLVTHLLVLVLGLIVTFRPSLLKSIEARANRWVSPRRAMRWLDQPVAQPGQYLVRHPRWSGFLLVLAGLYVLGSLWLVI